MNHNPYTAPQSNLDDYDYFEYDTTPFYKPTGRIGRVRFLAYNGIWFSLMVIYLIVLEIVVGKLGLPTIVITIFGAVFVLYAVMTPIIRRLTDLGHSRWWAVLYFVPYLNAILFLYLLFAVGDEGVNDYGMPATAPTAIDYLLLCLIPMLMVATI